MPLKWQGRSSEDGGDASAFGYGTIDDVGETLGASDAKGRSTAGTAQVTHRALRRRDTAALLVVIALAGLVAWDVARADRLAVEVARLAPRPAVVVEASRTSGRLLNARHLTVEIDGRRFTVYAPGDLPSSMFRVGESVRVVSPPSIDEVVVVDSGAFTRPRLVGRTVAVDGFFAVCFALPLLWWLRRLRRALRRTGPAQAAVVRDVRTTGAHRVAVTVVTVDGSALRAVVPRLLARGLRDGAPVLVYRDRNLAVVVVWRGRHLVTRA